MNRQLTVMVKGGEIKIIGSPFQSKNPVTDMALLCEAICTLIHTAHRMGVKKDYKCLKSCIRHLEQGFADDQYRTPLVK